MHRPERWTELQRCSAEMFLRGRERKEVLTQTDKSRTLAPTWFNIFLSHAVPQGQKVSLVAVNRTKTLLVSVYQEHRTGTREVSEERFTSCAVHRMMKLSEPAGSARMLQNCRPDGSRQSSLWLGVTEVGSGPPPEPFAPPQLERCSQNKVNQVFLEVKNRNEKSDSFRYNFTICLSTMFDFTNVLQLVQGLEMMQLLGVNRVAIYKTSSSPEIQQILDYYTHKGLVEVIPWSLSRFVNVSRGWLPEHGPGDLHYFGQIPTLNDCLYRYMYRSRYVALQDIDELIPPQSVNSWLELLPLLERKYSADRCYMFENNIFPITVLRPPPGSQILADHVRWQNVSGVNILAHLYQEPIISETRYNFKIIVNPRAMFSTSVHELLSPKFGCSWVERNIARMYHTSDPTQPELTPDRLIYDGRLLSYSAQLIAAFVSDGIFKAELNEFLTRELAEDGYSGVEVRVTPTRTEIIILATRTQNVLGEKGRRIRELTAVVQKRFGFPEGSVELYAEKVATRGLCAIAQAESLRYKLLGGLAVRRACYGVLRFIMESGAKGCEVVVSGKLRGQRAKSMKFVDGLMIHSGDPVNYYVDTAVRHVLLRQGVLGIKVKIMLPWDPSGKIGPKKPLPDHVSIVEPKEETLPTTPISEQKGAKPEVPVMPQGTPVPTA
ncbi:hypothetical protein L3Q82_018481 [Scortum barcoo]|uniref:Uncharacterized protein n=1 Tax=Scortum barcoo TaxID=214431 RepID=A0ACB8VEV7_9TELE|nr:hypothetical protein L3Q82_018481 [Scortum barcoo]